MIKKIYEWWKDWKDTIETQRKINKALREFAQEMNEIYLEEFRKYYEPKIRELLEEKKNATYKN